MHRAVRVASTGGGSMPAAWLGPRDLLVGALRERHLIDGCSYVWHVDEHGNWNARDTWLPGDDMLAMALSPDGRRLITCNIYSQVQVWRVHDLTIDTLQEHTIVKSSPFFAWAPDSSRFVTTDGARICVWKADDCCIEKLIVVESRVDDITWSPCGKTIAIIRRDKWLSFLNAATMETHGLGYINVHAMAWSLDAKLLAFSQSRVLDYSDSISIVSSDDLLGEKRQSLEFVGLRLTNLAWSENHLCAAGRMKAQVFRRRAADDMLHPQHELSFFNDICTIAWSPDGRLLAVTTRGAPSVHVLAMCKYTDRTHCLFGFEVRALVLALMCTLEQRIPLELCLVLFQQIVHTLDALRCPHHAP